MPVQTLDFAEPFFAVRLVRDAPVHEVRGRAILLNLSDRPIGICAQTLGHLQSVIVADVDLRDVGLAVIIERFDAHTEEAKLFENIRQTWPSAYDVRQEDRLKGISHYMSSKVWVGQFGFTMYHSGSVPLNVGLHRDHAFCPVPGFREVHTQIVGFGKMQQCREPDISTLYLEEPMAPGATHRPMYDADGTYPWHQFETITPSVFLAVEMLPDGVDPPK